MLNLILALAGIFALIVGIGRLLHRYFIYLPDCTRVDPKDAGLQGVEEINRLQGDRRHQAYRLVSARARVEADAALLHRQ